MDGSTLGIEPQPTVALLLFLRQAHVAHGAVAHDLRLSHHVSIICMTNVMCQVTPAGAPRQRGILPEGLVPTPPSSCPPKGLRQPPGGPGTLWLIFLAPALRDGSRGEGVGSSPRRSRISSRGEWRVVPRGAGSGQPAEGLQPALSAQGGDYWDLGPGFGVCRR